MPTEPAVVTAISPFLDRVPRQPGVCSPADPIVLDPARGQT
jgi:hypothetical protein